ncbi:TetR/AcrR family transcriptional regulator [Herminiimonas aquatilis]|uniref:TetR/AcrR family transcriptional regulator n=1 Tax=Herminiimonas aquatilis TaxID=345342 RepID=A0ABW2J6Y0_9BURK
MEDSATTETMAKLLAATERLIYAGGICATGMDAIVKASGVARKTIYRYFATKDELVAAALSKRDEHWMRWFIATSNKADTPEERLLATFDALEEWFFTPDFRGCAFINAAGEIGDASTSIRAVAKEHKIKLRNFLRELAEEYGAENPDELAMEFLILIDGAITVALVMGNKEAVRDAKKLARKLLQP